MDWNLVKEISEPLKNYAESAALLGAGFAWWKWLRERHDHATEVLFALEKTFADSKLAESRLLIEDDARYGDIAPVLARCVRAALAPSSVHKPSPEDLARLGNLDELLRFYVFLYSVRQARQVP